MTHSDTGRCPIDGCGHPVTIPGEEAEAGSHLWECPAGHHGPETTGFDGYATR